MSDRKVIPWDEFVQGVIKANVEGIDFHIKKYVSLMELAGNFNKIHNDERLTEMNAALAELTEHMQTALEKTQALLAPGAN